LSRRKRQHEIAAALRVQSSALSAAAARDGKVAVDSESKPADGTAITVCKHDFLRAAGRIYALAAEIQRRRECRDARQRRFSRSRKRHGLRPQYRYYGENSALRADPGWNKDYRDGTACMSDQITAAVVLCSEIAAYADRDIREGNITIIS